jgi:hypothetical protein
MLKSLLLGSYQLSSAYSLPMDEKYFRPKKSTGFFCEVVGTSFELQEF